MMTEFKKARPTTYQGVLFRSKSEACYAKWLTGIGYTWEYEPSRFSDGDYVPDFFVRNERTGASAIVEYKPARVTGSYIEEFQSRAIAREKEVQLTSDHEGEPGRTERLNRVAKALGHYALDLIRLHDHKGHLSVYFLPSEMTQDCDFYRTATEAWEAEFEEAVSFYVEPSTSCSPSYFIHCGSFFEDSGIQQIDCTPRHGKPRAGEVWFLRPDNFAERLEISRTRFDLADIL